MNRTLLTFLLILSVCPFLSAQWLTGWSNRQAVFVTETSGNHLANHQVRVDVAIQPMMNADFSDLRFTTNDGTTLIDYWVEVFQSGTSAVVWIEVPSLAASVTDSVFMYYGNAGATSLSNGAATFLFFDDFTTYSGWNDYNNGGAAHDVTTFPGMSVLRKEGACDPSGMWKSLGATISSFRMISREIRVGNFTDCSWNRYGIENAAFNGYTIRRDADRGNGGRKFGFERRNGGSASHVRQSNMNHPRGSWYRTELAKDCSTGEIEALLFDDNKTLIGSHTNTDNAYCSFDRVTVRGGRDYFLDYIAVANYETSAPQISFDPPSTVILSFDLLDFEVDYTQDGNLLMWELERLDDVVEFELQYSADAVGFETFEKLSAYGLNYDFLDVNYRNGRVAYYRIAARLLDGTVEYSSVKAVELPQKKQTLTLAPNPVFSDVRVIFGMEKASTLQVLVVDINGRVVHQQIQEAERGDQEFVLNLSNLPSGMYNLVLSDGITNRVRRFIKQ